MLERARRKAPELEWIEGDALALPFADESFDAATVGFGVRNLSELDKGLHELRRVLHPGGRLAILEITRPTGLARPFLPPLVRRPDPGRGKSLAGRLRLHVPSGQRASLSGPAGTGQAHGRGGLRRDPLAAVRRRDRRPPHGGRSMSALATVRAAPGLDAYLDELEDRLAVAVGGPTRARRGDRRRSARLGREAPAPAARLPGRRPRGREPRRRRSRDRARAHGEPRSRRPDRRRPAAARARLGLVRLRPGCGASRRRLPLRARLRRARGDGRRAVPLAILADAALALVRGEGLERAQRRRPDTTVEEYLTRCTLKTAKLFEAACLLVQPSAGARRVRARARDRVPDRRRLPRLRGSDRRDGEDRRHGSPRRHSHAAAPARGPGGRGRPRPRSRAARSTARCSGSRRAGRSTRRRQVARNYAERALACLDGLEARDELEAIAEAVVDRTA